MIRETKLFLSAIAIGVCFILFGFLEESARVPQTLKKLIIVKNFAFRILNLYLASFSLKLLTFVRYLVSQCLLFPSSKIKLITYLLTAIRIVVKIAQNHARM